MMIPVRCFRCGKVIAGYWESYRTRVMAGDDPSDVLDDLGITRVCCRRMFVTHPWDHVKGTEPIDEAKKYTQ